MNTASPVEILAVVFNVLGLLAAWRMLVLTKARYDAVLSAGGTQAGPRVLAAWRHFRCEAARIVYHAFTLGVGIWAMGLPDASSPYGLTAMWGRAFLSALFTLMSVMDLLTDSRLAGMLSDRPSGSKGPA